MLFLFAILIVCFCGCKERNNNDSAYTQHEIETLHLENTKLMPIVSDSIVTVDLNPFLGNKMFDFGDLVKNVSIVPLETTDKSLISNIYKIIVSENHIYVFDDFKGGGVAIFSRSGTFVKRLPHGGGPGEITMLHDIAYDRNTRRLLVYQHPFLFFYTSTGDYIEQVKLPFGFYNFIVLPTGYLFKTLDGYGNEHLRDKKNFTVLVTNKDFALECVGLPTVHMEANYGGYSYLYENEGCIGITNNNNDTIFHYNDSLHRLDAIYVMDYKDKKVPMNYWNLQGRDFSMKVSQNDYYYYIGEYLETTSCQAFFLRNDYRRMRTVVYRNKNTGKLVGGSEAHFNPREIPAIAFPTGTYKDYFVSVHYPNRSDSLLLNSSKLTLKDKKMMLKLKEDDNPVLVLFQIEMP